MYYSDYATEINSLKKMMSQSVPVDQSIYPLTNHQVNISVSENIKITYQAKGQNQKISINLLPDGTLTDASNQIITVTNFQVHNHIKTLHNICHQIYHLICRKLNVMNGECSIISGDIISNATRDLLKLSIQKPYSEEISIGIIPVKEVFDDAIPLEHRIELSHNYFKVSQSVQELQNFISQSPIKQHLETKYLLPQSDFTYYVTCKTKQINNHIKRINELIHENYHNIDEKNKIRFSYFQKPYNTFQPSNYDMDDFMESANYFDPPF